MNEGVNQTLKALRKIYSSMNYEQFCELNDFVPSTYAMEKFTQLKRGIESLTSFDAETIERMVNHYSFL